MERWMIRWLFEWFKNIRGYMQVGLADLSSIRRRLGRIEDLSRRTAIATEAIAKATEVDRRSVRWHVGTPEPE